jgi:hypothetical protein
MASSHETDPVSVNYIFKAKTEERSEIVVDWDTQYDNEPCAEITIPIKLPSPEKYQELERGIGTFSFFL